MYVKVLGTGTSVPSLKRSSSAYLVIHHDLKILVDAGPSVVRRLLECGYSVNDIDVIVITHFHVDHVADLPTFLFASNYGVSQRVAPLTLIGGQGMVRFYRQLLKLYSWIKPQAYALTVKSLGRGSMNLGDLSLRTAGVKHNRESIAVRIDGPGSVTFSGDTDYTRSLGSLAKGTDLLVVECSFPDRKVKGHMHLPLIERVVEDAKPKKVMLSHLYPEWEYFRGILHAPYILGEDNLEIPLP